jgi:hypothetical protein
MVRRGPPPFKKPACIQTQGSAGFNLHRPTMPSIRGLHSSTFQLNLSVFFGIGVHLGNVYGVFMGSGGIKEYQRVFRVYFCVRNGSG